MLKGTGANIGSDFWSTEAHTCLLVLFIRHGSRRGAHAAGASVWLAGNGSECALHDGTQQDGVSCKPERGGGVHMHGSCKARVSFALQQSVLS